MSKRIKEIIVRYDDKQSFIYGNTLGEVVGELVRCKECRHSFINENHPQKPRICGLTKKCGTTKDDWFCSDGEREGESDG